MPKYLLLIAAILLVYIENLSAKNTRNPAPPDSICVYMTNMTMECGKKQTIDIKVKNFKNVTNFQFSVNFMENQIKGESIKYIDPNFPDFSITPLLANGDISFSWAGTPVTLLDDAVLFTLELTPYYYGTSGNGRTPIVISSSPTPIQAYTSASTSSTYPVSVKSATIKIVDKTPPTAICPNSQFHKGVDSVLVASITGLASDDCGSAIITSHSMTGANNKSGPNDANGRYYKLGVTKIVYTATDLAGNISQCPFQIVLVKNTDDTLTLIAGSRLSRCEDGAFMDIGFFVGNANGKNLSTMNFSLEFDKSVFEYQSFSNLNAQLSAANFNTTMISDGKIGFTWSGPPVNLVNNSRLFTLRLRAMGNAGEYKLKLGSSPVATNFNSTTLGSVQARIISGDLIIRDYTVPIVTCKSDTLIYEPTGTESFHPILGSILRPIVDDNCSPQSILYTQTGATSAINQPLDPTKNIRFNIGTTNVAYKVTDYGNNTATCAQKVTINRLTFTLNKDSIPCTTTKSNINIRVADFEYIRKLSFEIKWNPAQATLNPADIIFADAVFKNFTTITGTASTGSLTFSFDYNTPPGATILADNSILLTLPFNLIGKVNTPVEFKFLDAKMYGNDVSIKGLVTNGSIKNYDTQAPAFTNCPPDITSMLSSTTTCLKSINWANPTITDNCDANIVNSVRITKQQGSSFPINTPTFSGDEFKVGTTIVTYMATDAFGNTSVCSFKVTIKKSTPPQITCPNNVTLNTTTAQCTANYTLPQPAVSDPCDANNTIVSNDANTNTFPLGTTIVTYKAEDSFGNFSTCSMTITVVDKFAPEIACPGNVEKPADQDKDGTIVNWTTPIVLENCSTPVVVTPSIQPNSYFKIGKSNVTYTATDAKGNSATCAFTVTVTDLQKPKINCPPTNEIKVDANPNNCGQTVALPTFSDNSGKTPTIIASSNISPTDFYPVGKTNITFTVKDSSGNTQTCSYAIIVKDVIKPSFTNAPDLTVNTDPSSCMGTLPPTAVPNATDACNNTAITVTRIPAGDKFPIGVTMVTFTATDQDGNSTTTKVTITVLDKNPPVIGNCPADITAAAELGKNGASVNWIPPTAQGFCGTTATLSPSKLPGSFFNVGNTIVTYTATDQNNNTTTCTFNVKVVDNQAPTINCPPNNKIDTLANPTLCGQNVPLPKFMDNSGQAATIVSSVNVSPTNFYPVGKTQVSFTVSDNAGNTAVCAYTIFVKDVIKPTFSNVKDLSVNNTTGVCTGKVSPTDLPKVSDACGNLMFTVKSEPSIDGDFPVGTTTVLFTATDSDGNTNTATIKVTVIDNELPTLSNCPSKIELSTELGKDGAIATWSPPVANDNCDVTLTTSHTPNTYFKLGTTTVTYKATDKAGNMVTCSFDVIVKDTESPVIACNDIVVSNDGGKCGASITLPTITDNIKADNIVYNPSLPANNYFAVGTDQTFVITASDAAGNTANCNLKVKVSDTEAPKVSNCPKDVTIIADAGKCDAILNPLPIPTFTDNCDASNLKITSNRDSMLNGNKFHVSEPNIVTYYAKDAAGYLATCSYKVWVVSDVKPNIICPNDINVAIAIDKCDTILSWTPPVVTQGCSAIIGTATSDIPSGAVFKAGTTKVNYIVKDKNGLEGTCAFTVNVKETTAPNFDLNSIPKDVTLAANAGDCLISHDWIAPIALDKCSAPADVTVTQTSGPNAKDKLKIGDYVVIYRAIDKAGNTKEVSFSIKVNDQSAPVFLNCPKNDMKVNIAGAKLVDIDNQIISVAPTMDCKEVIVNFKTLDFVENCSTLKTTPDYVAKFPIGVKTPYSFIAIDAEGNKAECKVNIEVVELDLPKIALSTTALNCENETIQLIADSLMNTQYAWTGPNGFISTDVKPIIKNLNQSSIGEYKLKITQNGCTSKETNALLVDVLVSPTKAKEDLYSVYSGDELIENVTVNDSLRAGQKAFVQVKTTTKNGTLKMRNEGEFTYVSNRNFVGNDEFYYTVAYESCPNAVSQPVLARIVVKAKEARVPNVITPNGDGVNDSAIIDYPFNGKEKAELYIFNEWGHEVYRAVPYDNSKAWNGTFNGNLVPEGTYYFKYIPDEGLAAQKGFITVLR
jgi:gliding motility-associated-like protein